jgi:hypothetical protein
VSAELDNLSESLNGSETNPVEEGKERHEDQVNGRHLSGRCDGGK